MMDIKDLQIPVSQIEIGTLENLEGMPAAGRSILRRLAFENDCLKAALTKIEERFKEKQNLHKDDCFAYQVASKALSVPPTEGAAE